jgi:hypothetical protein
MKINNERLINQNVPTVKENTPLVVKPAPRKLKSYVVQNEDGVKYRRNRVKIRPTDITANIRDRSPPRSVTTEKSVNAENHERNDDNSLKL